MQLDFIGSSNFGRNIHQHILRTEWKVYTVFVAYSTFTWRHYVGTTSRVSFVLWWKKVEIFKNTQFDYVYCLDWNGKVDQKDSDKKDEAITCLRINSKVEKCQIE